MDEVRSAGAPEGGSPIRSPVEIRLLVEPTRLSMSERHRCQVGLVATNVTESAIDPQLFATRLFVNGAPSVAFDLALGNSVMPARWDVLPAGETTPPMRWGLGEALFSEPGEYLLVLRLEVGDWPPVQDQQTVVVTPDG